MNRAAIIIAAMAIAGATIALVGPAALVAATAVLIAVALFSNSGASAAGVVCTACTTRCSCA